jgi:hypothetical protein
VFFKADILFPPGGVQYEYVTGPHSESGEDTPPGAEGEWSVQGAATGAMKVSCTAFGYKFRR